MDPRSESVIFAELAELCTSPGYVHAIAFLSFRDNVVDYAEELTAEDLERGAHKEALIRREISILIGLMLKQPVDFRLPHPRTLQHYIDRTEALLEELHQALARPMFERLASPAPGGTPELGGAQLREPMFYGPESAYDFQYRDLAIRKYGNDNPWLVSKKGFSIDSAGSVFRAIRHLQQGKIAAALASMQQMHPDEWTFLPAFTVTTSEISAACGTAPSTVEAVLLAFSVGPGERNEQFCSLDAFNVATATPLLHSEPHTFIVFQSYQFAEALYETPFYWMLEDEAYRDEALTHRGSFTEHFCLERLERVFGKEHVYPNVKIPESQGKTLGEIDVLVVIGNRALVLQAKSKRLTNAARRGDDASIQSDFKRAVQDAYDQALVCARALLDCRTPLVDAGGRKVAIPLRLKEICLLCVVSDHYPALPFQARQFLKVGGSAEIRPPFVLDVFALDAISEMLESPLHFLSYVSRRSAYAEKVIATHELMVLAYHLKKNLWVDDELSAVVVDDSMSRDLDVAMLARREGIPGSRTPEGLLTRFASTTIGRILRQLEVSPNPATFEIGFLLLALGEETIRNLNAQLERLAEDERRDRKGHDLTIVLDKIGAGLTIHCNDQPEHDAKSRLAGHCTLRKYAQKAARWGGLCISSAGAFVRFGVSLDFPWEPDSRLDESIRDLKPPTPWPELRADKQMRGADRNKACPCGSRLKYKKCCGK